MIMYVIEVLGGMLVGVASHRLARGYFRRKYRAAAHEAAKAHAIDTLFDELIALFDKPPTDPAIVRAIVATIDEPYGSLEWSRSDLPSWRWRVFYQLMASERTNIFVSNLYANSDVIKMSMWIRKLK